MTNFSTLRMLRAAAAVVTASLACMANAQVMQGGPLGKPASALVESQLQPAAAVQVVEVPVLDMKQIEDEDALLRAGEEPPRYAIPNAVQITPTGFGSWERVTLPGGTERMVWRLRTRCANAVSMNLGFTQFNLPESASLFVHAPDHSFVIRPFTSQDNADHGQLWTPPVPGNEAMIELSVDPREQPAVQLELGSINAGYRGFRQIVDILAKADTVSKSGSCNIDVICSQGDAWRSEISSVAVISTGGSRFCTGFMVNNVRQDLTPYFMTAAHCSVTASNAPSLVCYWNYENSTCRPTSTSGSTGNGQLTQFNTGATWLATSTASDFTLTRLSASPNAAWYVSFAGWDARNNAPTASTAIHHPNVEEKRISFDYDPATTTSYNSSSSPGDGTHWRIGNWEVGTTEGGSSGSPLFDQNHRVIGQLHGGSASCTSITNDFYGKLAVSWLGGGTSSTQLKTWLDPDNTGTLFVDTISTRGISVSPNSPVTHTGLAGGPFTQTPYTYTLANSTLNGIGYTVALTNNIGLLINGGTATVSGTVPASGSATVTVTAGPALASKPAGIYTEDIVFTDLGNGLTRTVRHTVEIGQTGISITPATGLTGGGAVGGPFTATASYVITSTQPSPVDVSVTSNAAWISIDGSASANFTLSGSGASRTVVVGIGASATGLAAGVYNGTVTISNASGGSGSSTRAVQLEVGRSVYAATGLPLTVLDNSSVTSTINVPDDFCIADVDVAVDIAHTFIGDLIVELTSPTGTTVTLHNRSGSGTDNIIDTYNQQGGRATDGPGTLADFNYETSKGNWKLKVSDKATTDTGSLRGWSLRMVGQSGNCPQRVVAYSVDMETNPGWTTQGQWAWGTPTGGGASTTYKDPTAGKTGTKVYGYNLAGDYTNSMPAYNLTSTAFDCTGLTGTRVSFWRWLGVESTSYDKASFSVSTDGTTWTTVWQNTSSTINDNAWVQVNYDISALADDKPAVYFRWTMGTTDTSVVYCGWNIDDLAISGFVAAPACPSDLDQNGVVDAGDIGVLLLGFGDCPASGGCPSDLDQNGVVDAGDIGVLLLSFGNCP